MPDYSPGSVLVTGGAGFIGCNFIRHVLSDPGQANLRVINLDLLTYAADPESIADLSGTGRYRLIEGDICDGPLVLLPISPSAML